MLHLRTILFTTDFSERSKYAYPLAVALARDHGAKLTVAHILEPFLQGGELGMTMLWPPEADEDVRTRLRNEYPADPRVSTEYVVADGQPTEQILRLAESLKCDLIVLGTHGRSGLARILAGSVAEEILRHALCPVLTVRMPLAALVTDESSSEVAAPV